MSAQDDMNNLNQTPPDVAVRQMLLNARVAQMIYAAAKLGIADLLKDGPKSSDVLAKSTGTHPRALYRLLRCLAGVGIFSEIEDRHFELTPIAECLRTGVANSVRAFAIFAGEACNRQPWGEILYSLKTGQSAAQKVFGMGIFEYFDQNREAAEIFNQFMDERIVPIAKAVCAAWDFSGTNKLVDVGGGHGLFIATVLKANPHLHGVVFDLPSTIEGATDTIEQEEVADRCELVPGNFFESVPVGGDAYILVTILHEWDDSRAVAILKNCRDSVPRHGKILVAEAVIQPGNKPDFAKISDIHALVFANGLERTKDEYRALFDAAGFKLTNIVPTQCPLSIIEAVPV